LLISTFCVLLCALLLCSVAQAQNFSGSSASAPAQTNLVGSDSQPSNPNPQRLSEIPPLRPPKAEVPPGFWELYAWHVAAGSMVLAGVLALAAWLLTRPRPAVSTPPAVQAREALQPLLARPEDGIVLSRVSQVVRSYFSALCGLPRAELTTGEFSRAIADDQQLEPRLRSDAVTLLRACDERKFAPQPPAAPLDAVGQALKLIDQTEASRAMLSQKNGEPGQTPADGNNSGPTHLEPRSST
jgi:hypothetical protein